MPWGAAVTWEMITEEYSYSLAFSVTATQKFLHMCARRGDGVRDDGFHHD